VLHLAHHGWAGSFPGGEGSGPRRFIGDRAFSTTPKVAAPSVPEGWHTEQLARKAGELRSRGLAALRLFAAAEEQAAVVFDELADRGGARAAYRRDVADRARGEAARAGALVAQWERADAARQASPRGR
jgi:hypothetical protein